MRHHPTRFGAVLLSALLLSGCARRDAEPGLAAPPELIRVGPSEAVIAWHTEQAGTGAVLYKPAGSSTDPVRASETLGRVRAHEVTLTGLRPATRYTYWIEGTDAHYQCQTHPQATTPFSFLVLRGDVPENLLSLVMTEFAEFVLHLAPAPLPEQPVLAKTRSYVPVYGLWGQDSPYLRGLDDASRRREERNWTLDWGGLRLVFVADAADVTRLLDAPGAHTIGVVWRRGRADRRPGGPADPRTGGAGARGAGEREWRANPLHAVLVRHNAAVPDRPVSFVLAPGTVDGDAMVDGVRYVALNTAPPESRAAAGPIRIDVNVESARAVFLGENREVVMRTPPLKERRTCEECRRLADRGAYEESVQAYRAFIRNNEGHYQIDDAYFAIAEILDGKLFRLDEAAAAYRDLTQRYPSSSLVPLANQRLAYLLKYGDHAFKPLAQFEEIRKRQFPARVLPAERERLLAKAEGVADAYPDSALAPRIRFWVANQYRDLDTDRAVARYRALVAKHPDSPEARDAWLRIGETYYAAARYREALAAYAAAWRVLPELEQDIRRQMARARRNMRRRRIGWAGAAAIALIGAGALLLRPRGIRLRRIPGALVGFGLVGCVLLGCGWFIHEQFASVREMVLLAFGFGAAAALGFPFSAGLAEKLVRPGPRGPAPGRRLATVLLGTGLGLVWLTAGMWLTLLLLNEHYLVVIGM
ncbi:MAG: tetratricopeptide repeat protein [Kiritimatiellae bacterium]|nr:tetratricopeptide repeat protein [Kiritimatiellia bacterium]